MSNIREDCHFENNRDIFHYLKGLKVLVVNNDLNSCFLISIILECYGIEAMTAKSALEALEVEREIL